MAFPLGNLLGGIGSVASSIIGGIQNRKNVKDTIRANKQLAEYQYSKDLEMWNRMNEYNSPAMQMQRFKDAKLNPNLIYGQGNAGNASTLPKYQAPRVDYSQRTPLLEPLTMLSAFNDFRRKNAEVDLLNEKIRNEGAKADIQGLNASWMKGFGKKGMYNFQALMDAKLHTAQQNLRNITGKYSLQAEQIMLKQIEREWAESLKKTRIGREIFPYIRMLFPK